MAGKVSMSHEPREIQAILKEVGGKDVLFFELGKGYSIDLNSDQCQNTIKEMFSVLLDELLKGSIKVVFSPESGYKTKLFIESCELYVKDLNSEIQRVSSEIPKDLKIVI
ncbi:MAG TPA: hypothetical protein PKA81_09025 [Clostridia bacterium]|nr:hypothetical protein [Clostridia bacterium]